VLLFAEAYITSFGLLSLGGLACLVVGSYMLFDVPGSTFRLRATVIWSVAITFAAVLLFIAVQLLRAKRQGPTSGVEALIGTHALVSESIGATTGKVFFDGTYWNATSDVPVEKGATVRIDGIEGLRVRVSPLSQKDIPPAEGKQS
jgi:membrane-bound serine protease (ClpP class)